MVPVDELDDEEELEAPELVELLDEFEPVEELKFIEVPVADELFEDEEPLGEPEFEELLFELPDCELPLWLLLFCELLPELLLFDCGSVSVALLLPGVVSVSVPGSRG